MIEFERWTRQIPLFKHGLTDQKRIASSRIVVVGAGGLGSPLLLYLAAAGVRQFLIVDNQKIEITNLNRQVLFLEEDLGSKKVDAAKKRLLAFDKDIEIITCGKRAEQSREEIESFRPNLIVDCTDNMKTRFFLNSLCIDLSVPLVSAMVEGLNGMNTCIYPQESACFECTFGRKKARRAVPPIIGVTAGVAGMIEASCCLKIMLGEKPLFNEVLRFSLEDFSFEKIKTSKRSDCPACGSTSNTER